MVLSLLCRGLVVLLHGLNEHRYKIYFLLSKVPVEVNSLHLKNCLWIHFILNSGRYNDFAKQLNANGYKVYGMDWTGKWLVTSLHHLTGLYLLSGPLFRVFGWRMISLYKPISYDIWLHTGCYDKIIKKNLTQKIFWNSLLKRIIPTVELLYYMHLHIFLF